MRLKRLWIDGFKNLNDFEIDFSDKEGITVLIGNNGSGKSNVLEAISAIFADLYNIQNSRRKKIDFSYKVEYIFNEFLIAINVVKENDTIDYYFAKYIDNNFNELNDSQIEQYLPSNVLMIYSGDDIRILKQYYEPFTRKFQKSVREAQSIPTLPKMLYINSFFWTISLLSLLKSVLDDNREFCKKILNNNSLENIKISFGFNQELIQKQTTFLNELSNNEDEKLFTLEEFKSLEYLPAEKDLFVQLTGMVGQKNKIKKLQIVSNDIDTIYLSEGEKKQILIRAALEILADENSLILMDEPDANIHVANKVQIKTMLKEYSNRENILTTHSPTLTHAFEEKHICMLTDGKIENKNKQEVFAEISDGIWSYQEQNIFLSSKKDIILLVEGKHDKIHIEEAFKRLKNNYEDLDFDIFAVNGADNIKQLLIGIKSSFNMFDKTKKYIGIFDCDEKGKEIIGKSAMRKKFASLGKSENFYYMYLPFYDYEKSFEIENMYPENKLHLAYKEAINITTININKNSIEKEAKNQLSMMCKSFKDEDFEHFKKLFDLILEIKEK